MLFNLIAFFIINTFPYVVGTVSLVGALYVDLVDDWPQLYKPVTTKRIFISRLIFIFLFQVFLTVVIWPVVNNVYALLALAVLNIIFIYKLFASIIANEYKNYFDTTPAIPVTKATRDKDIGTFFESVKVHPSLRMEVTLAFQDYYDYYKDQKVIDPLQMANNVSNLFAVLPSIYQHDEDGTPVIEYLRPYVNPDSDDMRVIHGLYELGEMADRIKMIRVSPTIPDALRVEHHMIVATTGHGKTTTLLNMILKDLHEDCAIVVIDIQGNMIRKLATRVPLDRLILIDPETCPPALNMFAPQSNMTLSNLLELYLYIFSSAGQPLTGRQATAFSALCRLCLAIPGATLHTLATMLEPNGTELYKDEIATLGPQSQSFFKRYKEAGVYRATKEEIGPRMDMMLEEGPFADMVGAKTLGIDIFKEINAGKVILINTNRNLMGKHSPIFGRFFIGQVMQAVRKRKEGEKHKRVYLYCDEFGDFADNNDMLTDCFSQGRQYNLGMVICFQYFTKIGEQIRAAITGCTNIKFAGGVSADDITYVAKQMKTSPEMIDAQPKGTFLAYFKDKGTLPWKSTLGHIDTVPELHSLKIAIEHSRKLTGDKVAPKPDEDKYEPEGW